MDNICCMIGCENTNSSVPEVQLFPFPSNFDLCKTWVEKCQNSELLEEFTYSGIEPILKKYVCSQHFETFDFIEPELKRLKPDAVPFAGRFYIKTESDEYTQVTCAFIKSEVVENNDYSYNTDDTHSSSLLSECVGLQKSMKTKEKYALRKQKAELRAVLKRNSETAEQREARLLKNRIKVAEWRRRQKVLDITGTDEERALRMHKREAYLLKERTRAAEKRKQENDVQAEIRRRNAALRKRLQRSRENEEKRALMRQKDAARSALKIILETAEQREARLLESRTKAAEKRKQENELQTEIRRRQGYLRKRLHLSRETEEKRMLRRQKDATRAALKRSLETSEEREARLFKERIRIAESRRRKAELNSKNFNCNIKAEPVFDKEINNT